VKLTAGILGSGPCQDTRGVDPEGGGREVRGDPGPGPHTSPPPLHPCDSASGCLNRHKDANPSPGQKFPNLAKFVGHLWRGADTRSYAAALQSTPAKVVRVMNRGGAGRRGFGRDGFRTGRHGRGGGRTGARMNVWGRTRKQAEDQLGSDPKNREEEMGEG
jgi:hypothetical protein